MSTESHISVLLREACDALLPERGGTLVDATFGRGGHSRELLRRLPASDSAFGPSRLFALDRDAAAEQEAARIADSRFRFVRAHFGDLAGALAAAGVASGEVHGLLMDIGVSSPQLDDGARGFSFMRDGPLDMRMDQGSGFTAAQWLASVSTEQLAEVIRDYGEERFASRIAAAIVAARERQPVERTVQLAQIIEKAVPARWSGQHPATKTFQAIRIHVNQELEELRMALSAAIDLLAPGGRLAVITFHSLEDRIVKQWMRDAAGRTPEDPRLRHLPKPVQSAARMALVGRDIAPSAREIAANPRARSARLRVAERVIDAGVQA